VSNATEVQEIVKFGLQGSWLSKFFTKPENVILKSQNPEVVHFQDLMQADMKEWKLTTENVKAQLIEVMLEQKRHNELQAELIRKQEALEKKMQKQHEETLAKQAEMTKKQDETNAGIDALLEMMKKQHHS